MATKRNTPELRFPEFEDEWTRHNLGEIATFSKGNGISKAEISDKGELECIRYGELYTLYGETISDVRSKTHLKAEECVLSKSNDVIIPASGETQLDIATASCVLRSGIALGGDLNIIKSPLDGVFLAYYLNTKKKHEIASLAQGISVVHLYSNQLKTLTLSVPSNAEQNKIAAFLTAVDSKVQLLEKKKGLLQQYKKGIMQKIFNREIRFKDDDGKEFPGWVSKKLFEIGEIVTGRTPSTSNLDFWDGDVLFVTPTDISINQKYQRSSARSIKIVDGLKVLPAKSILFTCIASIGKMALSEGVCVTNQQINSVIPSNDYDNEFVYYSLLFRSSYIVTLGANTTVPIINKTEFSKVEIMVPCLFEQGRIANFLSAIDKKINHVFRQIELTRQYKKGLLQQMFV